MSISSVFFRKAQFLALFAGLGIVSAQSQNFPDVPMPVIDASKLRLDFNNHDPGVNHFTGPNGMSAYIYLKSVKQPGYKVNRGDLGNFF